MSCVDSILFWYDFNWIRKIRPENFITKIRFLLSLELYHVKFEKEAIWITLVGLFVHVVIKYWDFLTFITPTRKVGVIKVPSKVKKSQYLITTCTNNPTSVIQIASFSWSLEQFFLTVGQNNFGNKILKFSSYLEKKQ